MALLATTELEAVNIMLAAIQEAPVSTILDETIEDAAIALSTLRQVCKEVQGRGWHFNTDYDYPLSVDGDLKIAIPVTAAHVDPERYEDADYVRRGGYLYDRKNRTFTYSAGTTVYCRIVWMLDFEDLPQSFRTYVTMVAANRFANHQMGDEASTAYTDRDLQIAKAEAAADDLRRSDSNMLTGSASTYNVIRRRRTWQG